MRRGFVQVVGSLLVGGAIGGVLFGVLDWRTDDEVVPVFTGTEQAVAR